MSKAKLYIVATPIGNLGDITFRAIEALKAVDVILAEDTRETKKLLKHYEINKQMYSFHQHNEHKSVPALIEQLQNGTSFALCSDAGTPGISDPGFLLIRACVEHHIDVISLPGPTAVISALVSSGLPCDRFVFEGFLPHKKGKQTKLKSLIEEERTVVFYESPHRILKTLYLIQEILGDRRPLVICRELTKKFEEVIRGSSTELINHFETNAPKGEFVLIIGGKSIEKQD